MKPRFSFFGRFICGFLAVSAIAYSQTVTATLTAGTNPRAVAVNQVTNMAYVANYGSNNVTVINPMTNSAVTVSAGVGPGAVAVNPTTNKIYVANSKSNTVTVIDGASNDTSTVSVGSQPLSIAVNALSNKIYVANAASKSVTIINGSNDSTSTLSVGANPVALGVNPVTNKIYVANSGSNTVTEIDGEVERGMQPFLPVPILLHSSSIRSPMKSIHPTGMGPVSLQLMAYATAPRPSALSGS